MFRIRSDRGQGSLESVGIIVVASLLVAALVAVMVQTNPTIMGTVKDGICRIVTLGAGTCSSAPAIRTADDYVPREECVIGANGEDHGGSLSIAVVEFEGGETWLIENLGNGKSRLTRVTSEGVGLTAGVGIDFTVTADGTKIGLAASASASALFAGNQGDVFYADNPEQAKQILGNQQSDDTKDSILGDSGPSRWLWDQVTGKGEFEDAEPDQTFADAGFKADAHAGATLLWGTAEANVAAEAYLGTTNKTDGTSTNYFRGNISGDLGVDIDVSDAGLTGELEVLVEVDRDKDGNPVAMRLISATSGDAYANDNLDSVPIDNPEFTKTTIQIPLETEAQRDVASRVLWATGIPFLPGINDGITDIDAIGTAWQIEQIGKDLGNTARQSGYMWEEKYTVDTSENGFDIGFKAGVELGGSGKWSNITQALTGYRFWDGSTWATRPGCAA